MKKELTDQLAQLSDEAKYVAMFTMAGQSPVTVFQLNNSFYGAAYDAAIEELKSAGIVTELVAPTFYCAVYDVLVDLAPITWWFVDQTRERRVELATALSRRVPDDRDVAKALKGIETAIDLIKSQRHLNLEPIDIIDSIDRILKDTRDQVVAPTKGPVVKKIKPFTTETNFQFERTLRKKDIERALGGLRAEEGGDPSKSKFEWYFSVDGDKCAIWDWKGLWHACGPTEAFLKLNLLNSVRA